VMLWERPSGLPATTDCGCKQVEH